MIIFSGNPECPKFAHAVRVAQYLASRLPKFEYKMILKLDMNWKAFLEEINAENDWHFTSSPVIWEEIIPGGKKYKIGELGDFWEYVYNYYGLVSFLSTEELQSIIDENIEAYHDEKCTFVDKPGRRIISICGASSEITDYLLNELINLKSVYTDKGLEIKLHDKNLNDFEVKEKVYDSAYKINHMGIMGKKSFVKPEPDCEQAILGCDLLIFLGEYSPIKIPLGRNKKHDLHKILIEQMPYLKSEAQILADVLNNKAKRDTRIIFYNENRLNCTFASLILEYAPTIKIKNVVVPFAHLGLAALGQVANQTGVPISDLSAPPIWGSIHDYFIDIRSTIYKGYVCMPYERAVNAVDNSTLPLGVIRAELRYLSHLIRDEDIFMKEIYEMMDKKINVLKTETILSKVKCIMDVIRIWYDKDYESIISLGVYSTGCFGLPRGIVMSQPVCLSKAGYFVPCEDFPVTKHSQERILKIAKGLRHCIEQVKKQEEEQKKKMAIDNPLYTML